MGSSVECWSRCNKKISSIVKSTSVSLLLTSLIFLSVSSAPSSEGRRCHWCGPLAEQVHRSRRARPCTAPLQQTDCEQPEHYCATVATAPPYTESRLCVKVYQDECYPLYCNTTRTYKMTCPCRGDFCNGPNTPREEAAFKQLRQLAAAGRTKRSADGSEDDNIATEQNYHEQEDDDSNGAVKRDDYENHEPDSTFNYTKGIMKAPVETVTDENTSSTDKNREVIGYETVSTELENRTSHESDANQAITTERETNINKSSDNPTDGQGFHLSNEISHDHSPHTTVASKIETNEADNKEVTTKTDESVNDDQNQPSQAHVDVDANKILSVDDITAKEKNENENIKSDHMTTEVPNHENNEMLRYDTPEGAPNLVTITKPSRQDNNNVGKHGTVALDQKIEGYVDHVGSNHNDTCEIGTCKASGSSSEHVKPENVEETNVAEPNIKEVTTGNPTIPPQAELGTKKNVADKPTTVTTSKPVELTTTISNALSNKEEFTTNPPTTSDIKRPKQKNSAVAASGFKLLLCNAFMVVLVL